MKGFQLDCMSTWLQRAIKSDWMYHGRPEYKPRPNLPDYESKYMGINRSLSLKTEKILFFSGEGYFFFVLYDIVDNAFMHQIILGMWTLHCSEN